MSLVKVKDRDDIMKDPETGAIVNVNRKGLEEYKVKKATLVAARNAKEEINTMMVKLQEIEDLKKDIAEIKELLKGLVK